MALVTDAMSVWMERPRPSQPDKKIRESEEGPSTKERCDYNTAGGLSGGSRIRRAWGLTIRQRGPRCNGAHGRGTWIGWEGASQRSRVGDPGSGVNWLDGLI